MSQRHAPVVRSFMLARSVSEVLEGRRLLAATPVLVGDINQTTDQLSPMSAVQVGNIAYFSGRQSAVDGQELFKTDGTTAGTVLVKDINPSIGSDPTNLTNVNGTLFFVADDGTNGGELWKSDGTAAGTVMVKDINPGAGTSAYTRTNTLTNVNGQLYFVADDGSGSALWTSDGTAAGTVKVTLAGSSSALPSPNSMAAYNGALLVGAGSSFSAALYRVTGRTATLVSSTPKDPRNLTAFNGYVYFSVGSGATDNTRGDLWRTDGTAAGTTLVKAINFLSSTTDYASTAVFTVSGDRLYFLAGSSINGTYNLWATDGTAAGTLALTTGSSLYTFDTLTPIGTRSVLFGNTTAAAGDELWISDGTVAGTKLLKDIAPGTEGSGVSGGVRLADGRVLFCYQPTNTANHLLYTTDGTTGNTASFTILNGPATLVYPIGTLNGTALLAGIRTFTDGDLYRSDGTAAGTARIGATVPGNGNGNGFSGSISSTTNFWFVDGNTVYFTGDDGSTGEELWKSVGNAAPVRVSDIAPGGADAAPQQYVRTDDGSIYFLAATTSQGANNLYRLTPGAGAPHLVVSSNVGGSARIDRLTAVGNRVYFVASTSSFSSTLWRYDPATNAAAAVAVSGQALGSPSVIQKAGNAWYFGAQPMNSNNSYSPVQRLYSMTSTGEPQAVVDIPSGSSSIVVPFPLGAVGNTLFFTALTAAAGQELWTTDGTAANTRLLVDLSQGTGSTYFDYNNANLPVTVNGAFYFYADDSSGNSRIYRSDGTAAGTAMLTGADSGNQVVGAGGQTYCIAYTGKISQIARIDGTTMIPVAAGGSGDAAFTPTALIGAGNFVFAVGYGGNRTRWELWRGSGNLTDFQKVTDLGPNPDVNVGGPLRGYFVLGRYALAATANDLYFPAYDPVTGVEPYRLSLATTGSISGFIFDDTNADGVRQLSENPLAGETVYLDLNANGQPDAGEPTALSTAAGYTFLNVNVGMYTVRLQTPTGGRRTTTPGISSVVTVSEGTTAAATTAFGVTSLAGTAVIGGPATVAEGSAITLDGSASSEPFGTIVKYEWDFNYNGATFDVDATGPSPTFDAGQIDGPATRGVGLRVTDANGLVSFVTKTLISITNATPTARFDQFGPAQAGQPMAFGYGNLFDPGVTDRQSLLTGYDFNNDGDFTDAGEFNDARPSAGYVFSAAGTYTVHGRVSDKDGASTDYYATVFVYPPAPATTDSTLLEGESATFAGGTAKASGNSGYTGTGYADFGGQNSSAQWSVTRSSASAATLTFRYANGGTVDRPLAIIVNGATVGSVACAPTGAWTTWVNVSINANLIAGANTIKAVASATVGGANVDSLTIVASQTPVRPSWLSAGATWAFSNNTLVITGGTATLTADAGLTNPGVSIAVVGGSLTTSVSQHLGTLALGGTGSFAMAGSGKVLRVTALADAGTLDLNDNDLILDYTGTPPTAEVNNFLALGRAGGAWTGPRLTSTFAHANPGRTLGLVAGSDYLAANGANSIFDGEAIDSTSILIKSTFTGDATLDGRVDFNDFLRLQNSFGASGAGFGGGDFDYDGKTDFNDFLALQNNFGAAVSRPAIRR